MTFLRGNIEVAAHLDELFFVYQSITFIQLSTQIGCNPSEMNETLTRCVQEVKPEFHIFLNPGDCWPAIFRVFAFLDESRPVVEPFGQVHLEGAQINRDRYIVVVAYGKPPDPHSSQPRTSVQTKLRIMFARTNEAECRSVPNSGIPSNSATTSKVSRINSTNLI